LTFFLFHFFFVVSQHGVLISFFLFFFFFVQTAYDYRYPSDTVSLAVTLFDRYLSVRGAKRSSLQLLATTCLLIAVKFLEVEAPSLADLACESDGAYGARELKGAELGVLEALGWAIPTLTPHAFLRAFLAARGSPAAAGAGPVSVDGEALDRAAAHADPAGAEIARMASFFLDMSFTGYHFLRYGPTVLAAGAVLAACSGAHARAGAAAGEARRLRGEIAGLVATRGEAGASAAARDILVLFRELFPAEAAAAGVAAAEGASDVPLTPTGTKRRASTEAEGATENTKEARRGEVISPPTVLKGPAPPQQ
jgi:hypothetical protein